MAPQYRIQHTRQLRRRAELEGGSRFPAQWSMVIDQEQVEYLNQLHRDAELHSRRSQELMQSDINGSVRHAGISSSLALQAFDLFLQLTKRGVRLEEITENERRSRRSRRRGGNNKNTWT